MTGWSGVFLYEMYRSYKVADVAPIHFETLLAAMLHKAEAKGEAKNEWALEGVRQKAARRNSFLELLGFGGVSQRVKDLAGRPGLSDGGSESTPLSRRTLSRMLGRRGGK